MIFCSGLVFWSRLLVFTVSRVSERSFQRGEGFLLSTEVFELDFDENTVSFQFAGGRKNIQCLSVFHNLSPEPLAC